MARLASILFALCAVPATSLSIRVPPPRMGLFDALGAAFKNEEFKEDDRRVRASHILCKGDDDVDKIVTIMGELGERVQSAPDTLGSVFADLARRGIQHARPLQRWRPEASRRRDSHI